MDLMVEKLVHKHHVYDARSSHHVVLFLPREARTCVARYSYRVSSVRPSVCLSFCKVGGLWSHTL